MNLNINTTYPLYTYIPTDFRVINTWLLGGGGGACIAFKTILTTKQRSEPRSPTSDWVRRASVPGSSVSLANVPHGHATPAAQGHFSPTTVPFFHPKTRWWGENSLRNSIRWRGNIFLTCFTPSDSTAPTQGHGKVCRGQELSAWSRLFTVFPIIPRCRFSQSTATLLL